MRKLQPAVSSPLQAEQSALGHSSYGSRLSFLQPLKAPLVLGYRILCPVPQPPVSSWPKLYQHRQPAAVPPLSTLILRTRSLLLSTAAPNPRGGGFSSRPLSGSPSAGAARTPSAIPSASPQPQGRAPAPPAPLRGAGTRPGAAARRRARARPAMAGADTAAPGHRQRRATGTASPGRAPSASSAAAAASRSPGGACSGLQRRLRTGPLRRAGQGPLPRGSAPPAGQADEQKHSNNCAGKDL